MALFVVFGGGTADDALEVPGAAPIGLGEVVKSQVRPVLVHWRHAGLVSSHFLWRILLSNQ